VDSFDILLDAYQQIGDVLPLLESYQSLFRDNSDMTKIVALMYLDILEFHKQAIRFFSGRGMEICMFDIFQFFNLYLAWRRIFRAAWKNFDTRFKHILRALHHHKQMIESHGTVIHYQQVQEDPHAMLRHIQQYEHDTSETWKKLDTLEQSDHDRKYLKVLEWISGAPSLLDHESYQKTRAEYPGTGDWILKHEDVINWKDVNTPINSMLWLNGIPGAGVYP
jgi:hypothetical protein